MTNPEGHTIYNTNKQIRFKKSMPRSDLCDYNDASIVVIRQKIIEPLMYIIEI